MNANEAPEKLYFGESDKGILEIYSGKESNDEVEYTRTGAFIEKAAKWLEDNAIEYWGTEAVDNGMMIVEFKKAMRL